MEAIKNYFTNLINSYLNEFIEGFNSDQWRVGWTGELELKNLHFKKNALDFLKLPIRVEYGRIDSIKIVLNWFNLFSTPVSIYVYNLVLVTVLDFDSVKDEKKKAVLAEKVREKAFKKLADEMKTSSDQPGEFNEFLSKLSQVKEFKILNIHLRFEDTLSSPHEPLISGLTLDYINIQAESSNSNPKYSSFNAEDLIYKSLSLHHVSIYWTLVDEDGPNVLLSKSGLDGPSMEKILIDCITSDQRHPENLEYILKPVTCKTNVMINSQPHQHDFLIPVIDIDLPMVDELTLDDFKIGFTTKQFESFLNLYNYLVQIKRAAPHTKSRPSVPVRGNSKIWWKFATNAVIENEVRRQNKLWYAYAYAYKQKILNPGDETKAKVARRLEKSLDVFKIIPTRQLVEKSIAKVESSVNGHLANGSAKVPKEDGPEKEEDFDWIQYLERGMTHDEIIDFYTTIGDDTESASYYPKQFVAYALTINIPAIKLFISDPKNDVRLVEVPLKKIKSTVKHRPSSGAWNLANFVDDISVINSMGKVLAEKESNEQAIFFEFSVLPVKSTFEFGIRLQTSPLYFIYDPAFVNSLVEMVANRSEDSPDGPGEHSDPETDEERERIKRISYSILENAISNQAKLNVVINVSTFFFIIPSEDFLAGRGADAIVICPGNVSIVSLPRMLAQLSEDSTTEQLIQGSYDSYKLSISEVQMFLTTGTSWKDDIRDLGSVEPIFWPTVLNVLIQHSIVEDLFNLPKFKIRADVPSISVTLGDSQLFKVLSIFIKLPLPNLKKEPTRALANVNTFESDESGELFRTNFEVSFFIKEILIELSRRELKILHASGSAVDHSGNMVSLLVTFESGPNGSSTISSVYMSGFTLILAPDSLVKIGKEVTDVIASNLQQSNERVSNRLRKLATQIAQDTTDSVKNISNSLIKSSGAMFLKLRTKNVDLIVIEGNAVDDMPALIFNNLLSVDIKKQNNQISVMALVAKNQLSMTSLIKYLESKRVEAIIVPPADFTIVFHMDTESKVKHINFTFDAIRVGVSPNILRVLLSLIRSIASDEEQPPIRDAPIVDTLSLRTPKMFNQSDYWFLKKPVSPAFEVSESPFVGMDSDQLNLDIPSVKIILESGGAHSLPVLTLECSLFCQVDGWDSFKVNSSLIASYYNEKLHVWEPVIEQIDTRRPWTFDAKGSLAREGRSTKILIESDERLEFTVSKTFLSVANKLGDALKNVVKMSESIRQPADVVKIINLTGVAIDVLAPEYKYDLDSYPQVLLQEQVSRYRMVHIQPNEEKVLPCKVCFTLNCENSFGDEGNSLKVIFHYKEDRLRNKVLLSSDNELLWPIPKESNYWLLRVETPEPGMKKVTFGTSVEIMNSIEKPIHVFRAEEGQEPSLVSIIPASGHSFLPTDSLSNLLFDCLFFSFGEEYLVPKKGVAWKDPNNLGKAIFIQNKAKFQRNSAHMVALITLSQVRKNSSKSMGIMTKICIHPTLILQNLLPYQVKYLTKEPPKTAKELKKKKEKEFTSLPSGESKQLIEFSRSEIFVFEMPDYLNVTGNNGKSLPVELPVEHIPCDELYDLFFHVSSETTPLGMLIRLFKPSLIEPLVAQIFSPFWFINKTEMQFSYQGYRQFWSHPPDIKDPILFSFVFTNGSNQRKKEKERIQIQCQTSDWSEPFSIDAVGNQGSILCRDKNRIPYYISVDINLSSFLLTKIVTFSPFYNVINRTDIEVEVSDDRTNWTTAPAVSKSAFWPKVAKNGEFWVKKEDEFSPAISFKGSNSTLVSLANQLINVIVQVADSGITIQLTNYSEGACPVRIFNHTLDPIKFWQYDNEVHIQHLEAGSSVYYLWDDPKGKRILSWHHPQIGEVVSLAINEDSWAKTGDTKYSWVSFLDGRQRVLLISQDLELTQAATRLYELTEPQIEFEIALTSMGLSIVDNEKQEDLIYMGISGLGTIWEVEKVCCKKYKPLPKDQMSVVEEAYQQLLSRPSQPSKIMTLANSVKVDFEKMELLKPVKGLLRRHVTPALSFKFSYSDHIFNAHVKIYRVQVDNQIRKQVFGIIMCPVTPPKSVARDHAPKPFIELSLLTQRTTNINRFKMLNILIQEFLIQVDAAFLLAMKYFLGHSSSGDELNYKELLSDDLHLIRLEETYTDDHEITLSKAYFDYLHFSPIKLHLSFSLSGYPLPFFIRSLVSLTKFKDAIFRIDFFEQKNVFLDLKELTSVVKDHYLQQVLTQLYVIVFGLDLIGNPVSLILGIGRAVGNFFYEPFLGIIQGPEEFAQGVVFASESLFSQTIGGTAGALSRITGTLGDGVSALTMDRNFLSKRRVRMQRSPDMVGLCKQLAYSPIRGISGVVKRPIEGAQKDGCTGLVKGLGKGAVGLVAHPATGVIDFATGSMSAIKKAVDVNKEATKQRPARFFREDGIIEPYSSHEATGNEILRSIEDGFYAESDIYIAHYFIRKSAKNVKEQLLLITNLRIFALRQPKKSFYFKVIWKECFNDIIKMDMTNMCLIQITARNSKPDKSSSVHQRFINCESQEPAQSILAQLIQVKSKCLKTGNSQIEIIELK